MLNRGIFFSRFSYCNNDNLPYFFKLASIILVFFKFFDYFLIYFFNVSHVSHASVPPLGRTVIHTCANGFHVISGCQTRSVNQTDRLISAKSGDDFS